MNTGITPLQLTYLQGLATSHHTARQLGAQPALQVSLQGLCSTNGVCKREAWPGDHSCCNCVCNSQKCLQMSLYCHLTAEKPGPENAWHQSELLSLIRGQILNRKHQGVLSTLPIHFPRSSLRLFASFALLVWPTPRQNQCCSWC